MYLGTHDGLYTYDREQEELMKVDLELPSPYIMVMKEYDPGILTMGLWDGGVVEYNTVSKKAIYKSYENNNVYTLLKQEDGNLWVGTWGGGLFVENENEHVTHYKHDSKNSKLSHDVVYSLYEDENGVIWIGTNGGGINKVDPRKRDFVILKHLEDDPKSLSPGKINKVYEDANGLLWIGVYNNGINRYNSKTNELVKYKEDNLEARQLSNNQVNEFKEVNGVLYIGTNAGLSFYDSDSDRFIRDDAIPSDRIIYAIEQVNDYEIWLGTYNHGIMIYNLKSQTYSSYESSDPVNPLADNLVYDILKDSKGRIWIATNNGLNLKVSNQERFILFRKEKGDYSKLANNAIRSIFEDSNGRVWLSVVGGGLAYYMEEDGSFVSFTEENGLPSNVVLSTVEDENGAMWCSTENGIAILKPDTYEIFSLTPDDGIGAWEFSSDIIRTRDGSIMLGGVSGITSIPEDLIIGQSIIPNVYIEDVLLYNESIDENKQFFNGEELIFSSNETSIEFKLIALDYDSKDPRFVYKLEGFDDDWIHSGTRHYVSYSNLPAGSYEFKVYAETEKNEVSQTVSLKFIIKQKWYKTSLAYVSYLLLVVVVLKSIIKLREARLIREKNSELASLNHKLEDMNVELEKLSTKDALTNLYNRRYFDTMFLNYLNMAKRDGGNLSLIMIDIDDFKDINDQYGHVAGDMVLQDISEQMQHVVNRSTDFITRFGGDEFLIVLYDTDCENTSLITEKFVELMKSVQVNKQYCNEEVGITVSIGVGCKVPSREDTVQDFIELADHALYESKRNGKKQVTIKTR
jgi:diguanylate cyclase (GGDEF)-like protein